MCGERCAKLDRRFLIPWGEISEQRKWLIAEFPPEAGRDRDHGALGAAGVGSAMDDIAEWATCSWFAGIVVGGVEEVLQRSTEISKVHRSDQDVPISAKDIIELGLQSRNHRDVDAADPVDSGAFSDPVGQYLQGW